MMMAFRFLRFALLALMLWGVSDGTADAFAADLFVKPKAEQAPRTPTAQDNILELLDEAPPAEAPQVNPQTINEFANAYYKNCMKQQHPILRGESLGMLCACTAAKIPDTMRVEDMRAMQNNDAEGTLQRSRMLLFVYTPCIEYPTRALIMEQCLKNEGVKSSIKNHARVCECLGDGMAEFMREKAPKYIEVALRRNPDTLDPLGLLMQSRVFEEQSHYHMNACVQKHVLGGR